MRLLRALTLMLLMLHVVPSGAMRAERRSDARAEKGMAEHCAPTSGRHHGHHDSSGSSADATCCAGASCSTFGTAATLVSAPTVFVSPERTPVGPRTCALFGFSYPETPPPRV